MGTENAAIIDEIKNRERLKRDEEADGYIDFVETVYGPYRSRAYTETIMHFLRPAQDQVWLDAGAGVGRLSLQLALRVGQLVCIDHSEASLRVLRGNADVQHLDNIETIISDVCGYEGANNRFDGILCNEVLQHIPSRAERLKAVANLYRMLKPGGVCLINVISWNGAVGEEKEGYWGRGQEIYRNYFTRDELRSLMTDGGFKRPLIKGLDILPRRLTNVLPLQTTFLETWCSRMPGSAGRGKNLLAIGTK